MDHCDELQKKNRLLIIEVISTIIEPLTSQASIKHEPLQPSCINLSDL